MLWDLIQQRQIGRVRHAAAEASTHAARSQNDIANLERTVETLMLSCQAMWELVRERTNLTDEMLMQRMQEVDLRDGKRDGKIAGNTSTCKACSRLNNARRDHCVYCGEKMPPPQHVFA